MFTKEFYDIEKNNIIIDLENYWTIQRDSKTNEYYINIPFPTKEEIIDRFQAGIESPYEDLEDYESDIDKWNLYEIECIKEIENVYNRIEQTRKEFREKKGIEHDI